MRTRADVLADLSHLDATLVAVDEAGSAELPGVAAMRASLAQRRLTLADELRLVDGRSLAMVFTGPGAQDHSVDAEVLVKRLSPFAKAIDAVAQALDDAATAAGLIPAAIRSQSRLIVRGSFEGSFGLELAGPETEVQLTLDGSEPEPLFDRAVDGVLDVIDAARDPNLYEQQIVDSLAGLGTRALSHLEDLAKAAGSDTNRIDLFRSRPGHPQRVVPLTSDIGNRLAAVVSALESSETPRRVAGRLIAADVERRTFGVELEGGDTVRGTVNPAIVDRLVEYFGQTIEGTMTVTTTRSTISDRTAERFRLEDFAGPLGA